MKKFKYKYISKIEKKSLTVDIKNSNIHSFIDLSTGRTHYQYNNNGRNQSTIVLIPGATQSLNTFNSIYSFLVKHSFNVLRFDFYGKGYSDRPYLSYDRNTYIMQLKELLDRLNIYEKVTLIGHSFGGAISTCFVNKYPNRVCSIILISPVVNCIRKPVGFLLARTPIFGQFLMNKLVIPRIIERAKKAIHSKEKSDMMKIFMEQMSYKGYERSLYYLFTSNAMRNYKNEYKQLGSIPIKKYLLWGDKDKEIKEDLMQYIIKYNHDMQYFILKGIGHSVIVQGEKILKENLMKIFNIP